LSKSHFIKFSIKSTLLLCACLLLAAATSMAQSRKGLENKRKQLLRDIKIANNLLKTTTRSKEAALNRLYTLRTQINKREELVQVLNHERTLVDSNIIRTKGVVDALNEDIRNLETEYGEMARQAYRQKTNNSKLLFIFSAREFNQAYKRWQYLKQYDRFRQKQAKLIVQTKETLSSKINALEKQRQEKELLIVEAERQASQLLVEKENKNNILRSLKKDEKRIRTDLDGKQRSHRQLNDAIEDIIRSEIAINRKRDRSPNARKKQSSKSKKGSPPSPGKSRPEAKNLSGKFTANKGRLPWPVKKGIITGHFGNQPHPTLKKIKITNNGIDIQTAPGATVQAVFNGEVSGVQFIPGSNYMLIIKHGKYYTVYSNLEDVTVNKGEWVKTNQNIGRLSIDEQSNTSKVHFEVWSGKKRMNPVRWIGR